VVQTFLLRGRAAEARAVLEAIANAELGHFRDHGRFLACAPSADEPPRGVPGRFDAARAGWTELGVRIDGPVRFRYEVVVAGASFHAIASGDLDGDGRDSRFVMRGKDLAVAVEDELE
jgi:hypothetical protein